MLEVFALFGALLVPNIMRQLVYLKSYKKTGTFGFCVSPETRAMHKNKWLPWSGFLEELGWGSLWTFFWFVVGWQWTAFGWVTDALLDCAIAYSWSHGKRTPKILYAGTKGSFFVREVLLPYLIIGPIIGALGLNIYLYCLVATIMGIGLYFNIKVK